MFINGSHILSWIRFQTGSNENRHFHFLGGNPEVVNLPVAVKSFKCLYINRICKIILDFAVCLC